MTDHERHLRFPGTINFRDMGGYATADGGRVARRRLFRSGHLAHVEPDALPEIAALNITLVCDFRIDEERDEHPNRFHESQAPDIRTFPVWPVKTPGANVAALKLIRGEIELAEASQYIGSGYREFVREQSDRFAAMFIRILEKEHPALLLHCSAGKDRTGIAAAMLLSALGVSKEDVVRDYLQFLDGQGAQAQTIQNVEKEWARHEGLEPACSKEDVVTLFSVHPAKINAALDEMEQVGGSVGDYLRDVLGVSDDARAELRRRYVEPG